MKCINMITLKAAHKHVLQGKGLRASAFVSLFDLQELTVTERTKKKQHWTYVGNWSSVRPYWNGAAVF